jgi:hypothetical protein
MAAAGVGWQVFLVDGGAAFGAVRRVRRRGLTVYVEGGGEFDVPLEAIRKIEPMKVILDYERLPAPMREAIGHAADEEDYPPSTIDAAARTIDDPEARPEDRHGRSW